MTITDEELKKMIEWYEAYGNYRTRIKSGNLADMAAELLQRRQEERFIPVEERLPEVNENSISKDVLVECDIHDDNIRKGFYNKDLNEWFLSDSKYTLRVYVSRWRPLPAPPEVTK